MAVESRRTNEPKFVYRKYSRVGSVAPLAPRLLVCILCSLGSIVVTLRSFFVESFKPVVITVRLMKVLVLLRSG